VRILIDTDVLLDVALGREPWLAASGQAVAWAVDHPGSAAVAWHTVANIAYLAPGATRSFLSDLLLSVDVAPCSTRHALEALAFPIGDLEDALQAAAALAFGADWIVTRNLPDFRGSPVPALAPGAFTAKLA
jgi:predicted nucleic acid-binding protein